MQSALDNRPSTIHLAGIDITVSREAERVTGRVDFPPAYRRLPIPIDYQVDREATRQPGNEATVGRALPADQCGTGFQPVNSLPPSQGGTEGASSTNRQSAIGNRQSIRLAAVTAYLERRAATTVEALRPARLLAEIAAQHNCSTASLRRWLHSYDLEGPSGLDDNYTARPRAVVSFPADLARDAVQVLAWWAFRVDNLHQIDGPTVNLCARALSRLSPPASRLSMTIAAIDCCYSWPCDRDRYPFKPFHRWIVHDLDTWIFRAKDAADYRRKLPSGWTDRTAARLKVPASALVPLSDPIACGTGFQPVDGCGTGFQPVEKCGPCATAVSAVPMPTAKLRRRQTNYARPALARALGDPFPETCGTGFQPVDSVGRALPADTVASWLSSLHDSLRTLFLRALARDTHARRDLVDSLLLWWPTVPESERNNIDFLTDAWKQDHPRATSLDLDRRKLDMLLASLRRARRAPAQVGQHVGQVLAPAAIAGRTTRPPAGARR